MINKTILIGRLGKDPEIKHVKGSDMCQFNVATSESFKDKSGEYVTQTDWHNIVAFGKSAKYISENVTKGSLVYLEGKLQNRSYTDSKGDKRYYTQIVSKSLKILDNKDSSHSTHYQGNSDVDDLPF
jgi:single-strand DNA-binding protein